MQFVTTQHIDLLNSMSKDAVDSINRLTLLNLRTAHESARFATEAIRGVLAAREPRDFFALAHQAQGSFDRFLAYGRELFTLTTGLESRIRAATVEVADVAAQQVHQAQQEAAQQMQQQVQQAQAAPEVPSLDELVHAAAPSPASYPGQGEASIPDGPANNYQAPAQRDAQARKAARNQ